MAQVKLARAAIRDLEELVDYLRSYSPDEAHRIGSAILDKTELLAQFPEVGRLLAERAGFEYRQTVSRGYIIRYRLDSRGEVMVLSIRHGRRLQPEPEDLDRRIQ